MPKPDTSQRAAWIMFDWAAQPFYTLILTFLFAPYFANVLIGDAVRGQAVWGYGQAAVGLVIAVSAPLLGAAADRYARPKIWLGGYSLFGVIGLSALWWAAPGTGMPVLLVLVAVGIAQFGVELATVTTNAMMPKIAQTAPGRLSGSGMAAGYLGGLISLFAMLGLVVPVAPGGETLFGLAPVFGAGGHVAERAAGPLSALWYLVFIVPAFMFIRADTPGRSRKGAFFATFHFRPIIASLRRNRAALWFLIARMTYQDGLAALFAFGGIFAAGSFGWQARELGLFGIVLSVAAGIGAVSSGPLDDRFGPRRVIICALIVLIAASCAMVLIDPSTSRLGFDAPKVQLFMALAVLLGLAVGPVQAASRTYLIALAPPEEITAYFGLYAMSGKATAFIAPFGVAVATSLTGSLKAGLVVVAGLFVVGMLVLIKAVPAK